MRRTWTIGLLGMVFIVLMPGIGFAQEVGGPAAELYQYHRGQDVFFMLMLVAFLMLFIKKYEWGVCLATLLVLAVSWPLYLVLRAGVLDKPLDMEGIILAVFGAITLVIAIGVFLGQISTTHYIVAAALFVPAYMFNEWFMFDFLDGVMDAGGSVLVHVFAAYWGWGVVLSLRNKRVLGHPMQVTVHSVSFVWLAAMLLFVLWPSFVTALVPPEEVIPAMLNCYLALAASTLVTYVTLVVLRRTIDPLIFTYAMLAGGVAIGATVNVVNAPTAWVIGALGGLVSTLSFLYLNDWLSKKTGVLDSMGVHNLHGTPGILGGVAAMVVAGAPATQLLAIVGAMVIAVATGAITGLVLRVLGRPALVMDDAERFEMDEVGGRSSAEETTPRPAG